LNLFEQIITKRLVDDALAIWYHFFTIAYLHSLRTHTTGRHRRKWRR